MVLCRKTKPAEDNDLRLFSFLIQISTIICPDVAGDPIEAAITVAVY